MKKTKIFDNSPYMSAWEEIRNGEKWTFLETGLAISVIPIGRTANALEALLTFTRAYEIE